MIWILLNYWGTIANILKMLSIFNCRQDISSHLLRSFKISLCGALLVAQWWRISRPMQGDMGWILGQEDPAYRTAAKPMGDNYWASALEPMSCNYWHQARRARRSATRGACATGKGSPQQALSSAGESPRTATKTQCSR